METNKPTYTVYAKEHWKATQKLFGTVIGETMETKAENQKGTKWKEETYFSIYRMMIKFLHMSVF